MQEAVDAVDPGGRQPPLRRQTFAPPPSALNGAMRVASTQSNVRSQPQGYNTSEAPPQWGYGAPAEAAIEVAEQYYAEDRPGSSGYGEEQARALSVGHVLTMLLDAGTDWQV